MIMLVFVVFMIYTYFDEELFLDFHSPGFGYQAEE